MNKIINYFFEEDEKELLQTYSLLIKLGVISAIITMLGVIM